MKFIDWFAGVGGFRRGMELAGHECVGFCEFDKFAVMSYTAMHLCTQEQLDYLATLPLKERQKEILKEQYRNGEWYANDVRTVDARNIPDADCWCFGFPCQDISVAGKQLGFTGNRSSLFFRVMYMVGQLEEEKKPTYLFIENVKNLLSVNGGWDFARLLSELDKNGYDAEWQVLNSKYFGVPQNRERCFIIGHLRGRSGSEVFPIEGADGADSFHRINQVGHLGGKNRDNPQRFGVYEDGISPSLHTMQGGGLEPCVIEKIGDRPQWHTESGCIVVGNTNPSGNGMNGNCYFSEGVNPTLKSVRSTPEKMVGYNATLKRGGGHDEHGTCSECQRLQGSIGEQSDDDGGSDVFAIDKGIRPEEREIANCIESREDRGLSKRKQEGTLICYKMNFPCQSEKQQKQDTP